MVAVINTDTIFVYPNETKHGYPLHVEYTVIDPGKATVILLHGYMGSMKDFEHIIEWFYLRYNLIAIDLRGHGASELPKEDFHDTWTIASLAGDIRTVVTSILGEMAKVSIVASSLSTAIALEFTNRNPDLVETLFLISPAATLDLPKWGKLLLSIEKMTPTSITKFLISLTTRLLPAIKKDPYEKHISKDLGNRVKRLNIKSHKKIMHETVTSWKIDVSSITQPVLIIAGEDDKIVPLKESLKLNRNLKNSTIVVMGNTGHRILYHHSDIVLMVLNYWMKAHAKLLTTAEYTVNNIYTDDGLPTLVIA